MFELGRIDRLRYEQALAETVEVRAQAIAPPQIEVAYARRDGPAPNWSASTAATPTPRATGSIPACAATCRRPPTRSCAAA